MSLGWNRKLITARQKSDDHAYKLKKNGSILDRRSSRVYIFQMFRYCIKKNLVATWCLFVMSAFHHSLPAC